MDPGRHLGLESPHHAVRADGRDRDHERGRREARRALGRRLSSSSTCSSSA
jgi:hypothetical protein